MHTLFIEARSRTKIRLPRKAIETLPQRIGLFSTVQYLSELSEVKEQLMNAGKTVKLFSTATYPGQILGCTIRRFDGVDALLYVGDGMFHPLGLAIKNHMPVFTYDPYAKKLRQLDEAQIRQSERMRTIALKRYYSAAHIGILVSAKSGQCRLEEALRLKARLKRPCSILVADEFDFASLENFPFIDCFVNTACPRIAYDDAPRLHRPIVNLEDLA